jgi:ABC-type nitrate/sulfonate/bicarbonate transport system ATPase subunit
LGSKARLKGEAEGAVFPSDQVFNMTLRLRRITAEFDIPLERPRRYELKATETCLTVKR